MIITDINYYRFKTPLKKPFKTALRTVKEIESIYVFIETEDIELIGIGEAVPTYVITGDTIGGIEAAIDEVIRPYFIGKEISKQLLIDLQEIIVGNTSAKAAIDMALYDLLAQIEKKPLYQYLNNNPGNKRLETCYTVSLNQSEEMVRDALNCYKEGYHHLKIKLGKDGIREDITRLVALRKNLPRETVLSVDANQGWGKEEALQVLKKIANANLNIESIEQPVPRFDIETLGEITKTSQIPIMVDESLFSHIDAKNLVKVGAIDIWNIKLMKTGGIYEALKIHDIAHELKIPCMVGSMMETHVSVTAALHLALAAPQVHRVDFDAPLMVRQREIIGGIQYDKSEVSPTKSHGLGIDRKALLKKVK